MILKKRRTETLIIQIIKIKQFTETNLHYIIRKLFRHKIIHKLNSSFSDKIFNMIQTQTSPNKCIIIWRWHCKNQLQCCFRCLFNWVCGPSSEVGTVRVLYLPILHLPMLGKKRQVLHNSSLCCQDCWHTSVVIQNTSKIVQKRITYKLYLLMHLVHNNQAPLYQADNVTATVDLSRHTLLQSASSLRYKQPRTWLKYVERCFAFAGLVAWNSFPSSVQELSSFKRHLKLFFSNVMAPVSHSNQFLFHIFVTCSPRF